MKSIVFFLLLVIISIRSASAQDREAGFSTSDSGNATAMENLATLRKSELISTPEIKASKGKLIIISGGGARGAWGGGVIESLVRKGNSYTVAIGNSTGSLLAPLTLIDSIERLKVSYTTTRQSDIFDSNPFNKEGEVKKFKTVKRVVMGKSSIGDTKNLKNRIDKFLYESDYNQIKNENRLLIVATVNITKDSVEYKSSSNNLFPEMKNWIWVSCNQPVFMTLYQTRYNKVTYSYVDGGIKESIPLEYGVQVAKERGINEIDVVVNNTDDYIKDDWGEKSKILPLLFRTLEVLGNDVRQNDLSVLRHEGIRNEPADKSKYIQVNVYNMDLPAFNSCKNSLLFSDSIMSDLWERGKNAGNKEPNLRVWLPINEKTELAEPGKVTLTLENYPLIVYPQTELSAGTGVDQLNFAVSLKDVSSGSGLAGKQIAVEVIQGDAVLTKFFNALNKKNAVETDNRGIANFTFNLVEYVSKIKTPGAFRFKFTYLDNPVVHAETKSIIYLNGNSKKDIAEAWELSGFEALLANNVNESIERFKTAENVYNGFHNVHDIAIYLETLKDRLQNKSDKAAWNAALKYIYDNYSWKMPKEIKDRIQSQFAEGRLP